MRHASIILAALILVLAGEVVTPASPAHAVGKMICFPEVGRAAYDPIVHHNEPEGTSHNHIFFGNADFFDRPNPNEWGYGGLVGGVDFFDWPDPNEWGYGGLVGGVDFFDWPDPNESGGGEHDSNATTCQNADDSAVYWIPDLVYTSGPNEGESVPLRNFFAYYRTWNGLGEDPNSPTIPHHPNTRLVAGNAAQPADEPQGLHVVNWSCDQRSTRPGPYHTITEANCAQADGTVYLTTHVTFPTCWNGVAPSHRFDEVGDTRDNADFRYYTGPRHSASCPTGFEEKVSQLRLTAKWYYQGDGSDVALVTDLEQRTQGNPVAPGQTLHGDFWNTWVQTGGTHGGYQRVVNDCVLRNVINQTVCG